MYLLATVSTIMVLVGLEAFNYFLHRFDARRNLKQNENTDAPALQGESDE
jgi:hypothetical protein